MGAIEPPLLPYCVWKGVKFTPLAQLVGRRKGAWLLGLLYTLKRAKRTGKGGLIATALVVGMGVLKNLAYLRQLSGLRARNSKKKTRDNLGSFSFVLIVRRLFDLSHGHNRRARQEDLGPS